MDIGRRIRELREERSMTLEDLARASNYSKDYIWRVEKGRDRPSFKFLESVSRVFDVEIEIGFCSSSDEGCAGRPVERDGRPTTNEAGQTTTCLHCGNDDVNPEDTYCINCGFPLYNLCLNRVDPHQNRAEARRCRQCGKQTAWSLSPDERRSYVDSLLEPIETDTKDKTLVE